MQQPLPGFIGRSFGHYLFALVVSFCACAQAEGTNDYAIGADLSFLRQAEQQGKVFHDHGVPAPGLELFKSHGYNWVRLRLFHTPSRLPNNLDYTLAEARQAKQLGFKFLLDFHYSDTWADPAKQFTPKAWEGKTHPELVDAVFAYTRDTIATFRQAGAMPDMVQVGNEISHGMLWPDGKLPENWDNFADLVQAGIRGVTAGTGNGPRPKIMIHIDKGGNKSATKWFFDKLNSYGVNYDVIGQSYYPWWQGSLEELKDNLAFMANTYEKDIILVEVAYNWRPSEYRDKPGPFPETPEGQSDFLKAVDSLMRQTPQGRGKGIFWWEPAVASGPRSRGMFDEDFNALPVLDAFDAGSGAGDSQPGFYKWAERPPMGWNSWDCFATTVTESQTKAQTDYMAERLARFGWQYVVVDIQWYEPHATGYDYRKGAPLTMDEFGRLWPATNRFPSSANGVGFKALSDYVHSKGLKFGVHLLRGIPRQAVANNTTVRGTPFHATQIAAANSLCPWNTDMYGVDMTKPGAQEYYDSVFQLFALWGVDFVKVDDIARPYHKGEIEGIRYAIDHCGRPMVLSLSPGETPLAEGEHVSTHANMWRISDDFWDQWSQLYPQFERLRRWTPYRAPGHFPDADMLPLGIVGMGRRTRFTPEEQYTLITLWCIARSPLIFGGDMTRMDALTLSLLTNSEVLAVDQASTNNRELFHREGVIAWAADVPGSADKYLALFNTRDSRDGKTVNRISAELKALGVEGACQVRDLWNHKDLGVFEKEFSVELPGHAAGMYRMTAAVPTR